MPEYLAPGVYVEETSFRAKSIEGVGTSTTGFVGPTRKGPVASTRRGADGNPPAPPELITSFGDFVRTYGGLQDLPIGGLARTNFLAHAVLNFFNEGGSRLYVARVAAGATAAATAVVGNLGTPADAERIFIRARFPGESGNGRVTVRELYTAATRATLDAAPEDTLLRARGAVATDPPRVFRKVGTEWRDTASVVLALPDSGNVVGSLVTLLVRTDDADGETEEYDEVSLARSSPRYIGRALGASGLTRADGLQRLFAFDIGDGVNAMELHTALFPAGRTTGDVIEGLTAVHTLTGGTTGGEPGVGVPTEDGTYAAAFEQLRGLEDISIVAAPGHSSFATTNYRAIQRALISHVSLPRAYRIAVLDTPPNLLPGEAREERAQIDSTRAAIYYPWVTVANPLARPGREDIPKELNLPPSGFICGIYARNDVEQTVAKAPANEVVRGALRFESDVNFAQNQLLNPNGVNCLRYFPGRGFRVWGARTAGSDPEIKYVNVRRFLLYLESSIDRGTQWAVFENNGPRLWNNITETVEAFLYNEWVSGNLLGGTPKEAFFVRCDRSTMTQNDLDNGRLICLVGVALLKPAEFVIFRIGQKTADARS
jgi:phage tail sheath protein FI